MRGLLIATVCLVTVALWIPAQAAPGSLPVLPTNRFGDHGCPMVAIIRVEGIQTSKRLPSWRVGWGDYSRVTCTVEEWLRAPAGLREDRTVVFSQPESLFDTFHGIRPPLVGRTYVAWIDRESDAGSRDRLATRVTLSSRRYDAMDCDHGATNVVESERLVPLYGEGDARYVPWRGDCVPLGELRADVASALTVPLASVADAAVRNDIASWQIRHYSYASVDEIVRGMSLVLADPAAQARAIVRRPPFLTPDGRDTFGPPPTPYALWVGSMRNLQDLAADARVRARVLPALHPLLTSAPPRVQIEVALLLADHGDDAGRATLLAALGSSDFSLDAPPSGDGGASCPGRFRFPSSREAAAFYLGKVGDAAGLREAEARVVMAAIEGLGPRESAKVEAASRTLLIQAEGEYNAALEQGRPVVWDAAYQPPHRDPRDDLFNPLLSRVREDAHDSLWLRLHAARASRGDQQSLRLLAHVGIDAQKRHLGETWRSILARLKRLLREPQGATYLKTIQGLPESATLVAMLPASPSPTAPSPRRARTREEIRPLVVERLAGGADQRGSGMLLAATYRLDEFQPCIRAVALDVGSTERWSALRALGIYGIPLPVAERARLLSEGDLYGRVAAMEVLTGFEPAPDAEACANTIRDLLRTSIAQPAEAPDQTLEGSGGRLQQHPQVIVDQSLEGFGVRLQTSMARLLSASVPNAWTEGVADRDAKVRAWFVLAGACSGNPDVVPAMRRLVHDPDPTVRRYADWSVRHLPWPRVPSSRTSR